MKTVNIYSSQLKICRIGLWFRFIIQQVNNNATLPKNRLFSLKKSAKLWIGSICAWKCCQIKNCQTSKCRWFVICQITQTQTETETEAVRSHPLSMGKTISTYDKALRGNGNLGWILQSRVSLSCPAKFRSRPLPTYVSAVAFDVYLHVLMVPPKI